jgi:hypothetical protein
MYVLWRIVVKELQQLRRDPKMLRLLIAAPVIQLLALGYAANLDVRDVPLVLVDQDRTAASRDLLDRFTASGYSSWRAPSTASAKSIPGTLEQVMVSPVRPWQLIVGKLFPYAVIGFVDVFIVVAIVVLWFQVPLRGSFLLLLGLTMLLVLGNLGLGLLVSTIARNQQQAMMGAAFVLMLPQIYLSGLIFPIENMPPAIAAATYVIPLRYYTTILRGIFLEGLRHRGAVARGPGARRLRGRLPGPGVATLPEAGGIVLGVTAPPAVART